MFLVENYPLLNECSMKQTYNKGMPWLECVLDNLSNNSLRLIVPRYESV